MTHHTRRAMLRYGATAATFGLAGCIWRTDARADSTGQDPASPTEREPIRLNTYDVAGSPGKSMRVRPEGTVALLDFWATWCGPCKRQMPVLRRIEEQFPAVHMLSITTETDEPAIKDFWRKYGGTWPVASDASLRTHDRFGVRTIPTLVVTDSEGTPTWRDVGFTGIDAIVAALQDAGS